MAVECLTTFPSKPNAALNEQKLNESETAMVFDSSKIKNEHIISKQFVWPDEEKPSENAPEFQVPSIDLMEIVSGDESAIDKAKKLINHGVFGELIREVHKYIEKFFEMPLEMKQKAQRKVGENYRYVSSFVGRFFSKLLWKETLSFRYCPEEISKTVEDYFCNFLGEEFVPFG